MPGLITTTPAGRTRNKHEHLIFLTDDPNAFVGVANDHTHPVMFTESGLILGEVDGHTHSPLPLPVTPSTPSPKFSSESELVNDKIAKFRTAFDFEKDSRDAAHESVDFRMGKQWDSTTVTSLNEQSRCSLVFNHCASMVDTLSGYFRQNRSDIKFYPVGKQDNRSADALQYIVKQVLCQNDYEFEETDVFEDQIVAGRGLLEVRPDYDEDPQGKIVVRQFPWDRAVLGPHQRRDARDMELLFKWEWYSEDRLITQYPELKDTISSLYRHAEFDEPHDYSGNEDFLNDLYYSKKTKEFKVIECEEKEYERLNLYIHVDSEFVVDARLVPSSLRAQLQSLPLIKRTRTVHNLRRTVFVGNVILEDEYVDRPVLYGDTGPDFSLLVVYAYKCGKDWYGKIEDAKDPQREINKRRSQIADQANTCVNNGWFYDPQTFSSPSQREKFVENASTPGFVIEIAEINRPPVKVERDQISPALVNLEIESMQSFRDITNVRAEMMGGASGSESGVAILHKQRLGLVGNEFLFDNFWRMKKRLGRAIVGWIQKLYTPERCMRLLLDRSAREEIDPAIIEEARASLQELLDTGDLLQYDVEVGETGASPTAQLANFGLLVEAASKGLPIPPIAILEMAPIPEKDKIIAMVQQAQQAENEKEQRKIDAEIEKTRIAHGNTSQIPSEQGPMGSLSQGPNQSVQI